MSDTPDLRATTTPNFNLNLPDIGGDWDEWGAQTNANWLFMDGALLPIWGGQMTGLLGLSGDPTTPLGAATRQYVDAVAARLGNYLPLAGGQMTGPLQVPQGSNAQASVQLGQPNNGLFAPANGNVGITAAGTVVFSTSSITARFNIPLQVNADPTANLGVATKQYVDAVSAQLPDYLARSGGQMTGPLITAAGSGGSLLGIGIGNNTTGLWTSGGNALILQTGGATNLYLSPTGNQMGQSLTMAAGTTLTLAGDATQPMQAVTLQQMGAILGGPYLPIVGGVLTGPLTLAADPAAALQSATKQYVDATAATVAATAIIDQPNYLLNSDFRVNQRGAGNLTASGYVSDRWPIQTVNDVISATSVILADADRAQIGDESAYIGIRNTFTGSSAAGSYNELVQNIEGVRRLAGKNVTVSFWAKAAVAGLKMQLTALQYFGSGGSPSPIVTIAGPQITLSAVFQRYNVQLALPSVAGKTLGTNNDDSTQVQLIYSSQAAGMVQSGTVTVWGAKLNVGGLTPYIPPEPQASMADCQRFLWVPTTTVNCGGYAAAATEAVYMQIWFPVTMRASASVGNITWGSTANLGTTGITSAGKDGAIFYGTAAAPGYTLTQILNAVFTAEI